MSLREQELSRRLATFGPAAVVALLPVLDDEDSRVADTAAYAIARLGAAGRPAIPALRRALDRDSGWAAQALAATGDPTAIAALQEAALAGKSAAGALILMGPAGQRAFVEAIAGTHAPEALSENLDANLLSTRVDVSELVRRLIILVSDQTKTPRARGVACTFLGQLDARAAAVLPRLRKVAGQGDEVIGRRCFAASDSIQRYLEAALRPTTTGPRLQSRPSPQRAAVVPSRDAAWVPEWKEKMKSLLGDKYLEARSEFVDPALSHRRVERVAAIGVSTEGFSPLGKTLDWQDAIGPGRPRRTAEVFYRVEAEQHVDTKLPDWSMETTVSALGAVASDTFAVPDVEALTFVAGVVYDDELLPLFIVYIPREAASRFRWNAIDPELLGLRLPPENVGIATGRLKTVWEMNRDPFWRR